MDAFFNALYSDPLYYIGVALAFWAAIGFLTFLRGFLAGLPHLFTYDGDDEHLPHHRLHAMWGPMILMTAWGFWELARWIAALFTGSGDALSLWAILFLLVFAWVPPLFELFGKLKPKGGGGGH